MAQQNYDPETMAILAQETALKVGCQAVRWWQDKGDPHYLYIDATHTFPSGQSFSVLLEVILPEPQARDERGEQKAEQSAFS